METGELLNIAKSLLDTLDIDTECKIDTVVDAQQYDTID